MLSSTEVLLSRAVWLPASAPGARCGRWLVLALISAGTAGCQSDGGKIASPPLSASEVSASLTGSAAVALQQNGKFSIRELQRQSELAIMSAEQATTFALAFAREFAPFHATRLEEQRGHRIDYQRTAVCGRVLLAQSAYESPPPQTPRVLRLRLGPQWLVPLCDPSGPALNVAVAARATDLRIDDGHLRLPPIQGGEFHARGIPIGGVAEMLPPEDAVVHAAARTGKRVSAVPELVAPPFPHIPQNSSWRLTLEAPATLRTSRGAEVSTSAIYSPIVLVSGRRPTLTVAEDSQPQFEEFTVAPEPQIGETRAEWEARRSGPSTTVRVERRNDVPLRFVVIP